MANLRELTAPLPWRMKPATVRSHWRATPSASAACFTRCCQTGAVARELDLASVATYLSWSYLPGHETLVRGVYKVMPGEVVCVKNGCVTRSRWWTLPGEPELWRDEDTLRGELRDWLETAVRRRLPVGQAVGC